jgi:arsenate reductase
MSVLFLCTHNSARSQIAEAVLRQRAGDRFEVASAGSEPGARVHPLALRIIEEIGGRPTEHRPKGFDEVFVRDWDLVVTVCDQARDACPVPPAQTMSTHWGVTDPSNVQGSDADRVEAFRATLRQLTSYIDLFLSLEPDKIAAGVLRDGLARMGSTGD